MSNTVTSYIPTGNASGTRNADVWSYALLAVPQAMSAYLKFKEMGTALPAAAGVTVPRLLRFGGSGTPDLFIAGAQGVTGGYKAQLVTASGSALGGIVSPVPVVGNIVELLMTLASNGVVNLSQTINGGAAVAATPSAAKALPQTWAAQTFEITAPNTADIGIIACAVVRGVQSLDTMRRFAGTHTRNG